MVRGLPEGSRIEHEQAGWWVGIPTGGYDLADWPIIASGGSWPTPEDAIRAALEHKKELEAGG